MLPHDAPTSTPLSPSELIQRFFGVTVGALQFIVVAFASDVNPVAPFVSNSRRLFCDPLKKQKTGPCHSSIPSGSESRRCVLCNYDLCMVCYQHALKHNFEHPEPANTDSEPVVGDSGSFPASCHRMSTIV